MDLAKILHLPKKDDNLRGIKTLAAESIDPQIDLSNKPAPNNINVRVDAAALKAMPVKYIPKVININKKQEDTIDSDIEKSSRESDNNREDFVEMAIEMTAFSENKAGMVRSDEDKPIVKAWSDS